MAEITLTTEQQAVVDDRGGTLLVSAAAGSGKTKVLIDRVLRRVAEEHCNLDDFLMITYTNAAAAELRGKLLAQLSERLAEAPDDRHLQKQMSRVYLAQISTVHAFCNRILREYAHSLGLPPDFSMCDEQTVAPLRRRAMEQTMEQAWEDMRSDAQIGEALALLGAGRDDGKLSALIETVYFALQCYPDTAQRQAQLRESLDFSAVRDVGETVWGRYLMEELRVYLQGCQRSIRRACELVEQTECLSSYASALEADLALLQALLQADSWEALRAVPVRFSALKAIRNCPEPEKKEQVQKLRNRVKDGVKKYLEKFTLSSDEALSDLRSNAGALVGLLKLTEDYTRRYQAEKRRRHMLDYNDLEHEALHLLLGKDGLPTQAAREISLRYLEIMVDEYQDTNAVQDAIFRAISKAEQNLFFVGDVKQSIYGFRLADPGIFLKKYWDFRNYLEAEPGQPRKILLSDNFRSHPAILSAANDVFRLTMTERVGGLYYGDREALRPKKTMTSPGTPPVELHCIAPEEAEQPVERPALEAEFVAQRIAQMLQNGEQIPTPDGKALRPIAPEDIVILLRSMSGKAQFYLRALERHGICGVCAEDDLFDSAEVEILLSLLRVIDNPHQDIPLLAVLLSPVFCFSTQALAQARGKQHHGDLYDLLQDMPEAADFLELLSRFRSCAQSQSLRELLEELDEALYFRAIFGAMENGSQKVSHLERFFSLADRYESGGGNGLGGFLRHIDILRQKGIGGETAQTKGAVRLMTVHKSKGLEFPVVFLADLAKEFNLKDASDPILVDDRLGIAARAYDPKRRMSYPTIAREAIAHRKRKKSVSEEMRVLYVAMTRAKYRLVMTCCASRLPGKLKNLARELSVPVDESLVESASSMADWILMAALARTEAGALFAVGGNSEVSRVTEYPWHITWQEAGAPEQKGTALPPVALPPDEALPFLYRSYPYPEATQAPAKLTATQLKGRAQDEDLAQDSLAPLPEPHFSRPRFDSGRRALSPSQKGTAIHLAMQFIRYEACGSLDGVKAELSRLVKQQFITPEQYAAVEPERIAAFFASTLGQRVLRAENTVREFQFSIIEDASVLDARLKGEEILLQGITDCCLVEKDGLVILDFKSDRVAPGEEASRAEHYRGQLDAYSRALSRIFRLPIKERILYFFSTSTPYTI